MSSTESADDHTGATEAALLLRQPSPPAPPEPLHLRQSSQRSSNRSQKSASLHSPEQLDSRNSSQRSSSITSPIDEMTSQGVSGGSAHVRSSSQRSSSHMRSGSGRSNTYRSSGDKADGGESSALAHSSSFNTAGSLRREPSRCVLLAGQVESG